MFILFCDSGRYHECKSRDGKLLFKLSRLYREFSVTAKVIVLSFSPPQKIIYFLSPDLTQQLLHVFTNYVKLHLLASRFQEARTAVYIYLKAKEMLQQSQVENANIVTLEKKHLTKEKNRNFDMASISSHLFLRSKTIFGKYAILSDICNTKQVGILSGIHLLNV